MSGRPARISLVAIMARRRTAAAGSPPSAPSGCVGAGRAARAGEHGREEIGRRPAAASRGRRPGRRRTTSMSTRLEGSSIRCPPASQAIVAILLIVRGAGVPALAGAARISDARRASKVAPRSMSTVFSLFQPTEVRGHQARSPQPRLVDRDAEQHGAGVARRDARNRAADHARGMGAGNRAVGIAGPARHRAVDLDAERGIVGRRRRQGIGDGDVGGGRAAGARWRR